MVVKHPLGQCRKCGSYYTYITSKEVICRKCGHRINKPKPEGEENGRTK